jgi:hypothetical protein
VRSNPRSLNPNPVQRAAAFTPPPTGIVTVYGMSKEKISYWKTIRVAWFSGYKINWVIPGREGSSSSSVSVWNLDPRVQPVETIIPARTAKYALDPYVLVSGRPHIEPTFGTRVTVKVSSSPHSRHGPGVQVTQAPAGLGETARWLPEPVHFTPGGTWSPQVVPGSPDSGIKWTASEGNLPVLEPEYTYTKRGEWVTTTAMALKGSSYFRLDGMPLYTGSTPYAPVTMFFVADIVIPTKYWGSILKAVEPDGSSDINKTNLDLRLMPDGMLHPFTWGWQEPLPLVGDSHNMTMFGFTLDPATDFLRVFTIDRSLRIAETGLPRNAKTGLPSKHSGTSKFMLGRTAEAVFDIFVLDILMYRGLMDVDKIEYIASELDAAYGITTSSGQEQG